MWASRCFLAAMQLGASTGLRCMAVPWWRYGPSSSTVPGGGFCVEGGARPPALTWSAADAMPHPTRGAGGPTDSVAGAIAAHGEDVRSTSRSAICCPADAPLPVAFPPFSTKSLVLLVGAPGLEPGTR
jgi:hypothetical protein